MPIDYSLLKFAKGRPKSLLVEDVKKARVSVDDLGSLKVKQRSKGQCEVVEQHRCTRRALHVHHLLSGHGVRGRGKSALSENKLHVCMAHHSDIHAHVLVPDGKTWRRIK